MSKIWQPGYGPIKDTGSLMHSIYGYSNVTSGGSAGMHDYTTESMLAAMKEAEQMMEVHDRAMLRDMAIVCEKTQCSKCGRKPVYTNAGYGDVLHLCQTIWEALKDQCEEKEQSHVDFAALRIRFYPCEPRPPLQ